MTTRLQFKYPARGAPLAAADLRALDGLGIRRLTADSRAVQRGDTFVAYPGESRDGRQFIAQAIAAGAASVLWEQRGFKWNPAWRLPNRAMPDLRAHAGLIASHIYRHPSSRLRVIGVTGTNGKTTCSQWIARVLNDRGVRTAVVGTLGYGLGGKLRPLVNTTPDALWLQEKMAEFSRRGAAAVSMEVSSIGLEQGRLAGVEFAVALLTNLTRDHLDYHRTMARYKHAKATLFACESLTHAVLNLDDGFGAELAGSLKRRGLKVIGYGFERSVPAARRLQRVIGTNLTSGATGVSFDVATPWGDASVASPVLGRHNASNLLATLAVLLACEIKLKDAVAALGRLDAVPGRMQRIGGGRRPLAVIDYAHSPDALENVLHALRELTGGELWCVFGCGGDRDRGKRPLMGAAASRLADRVIVTSDNPRFENPREIINEIRRGVRGGCTIEPDRRRAITSALRAARRGDVVLIAGKGHEPYQEIRGVRHPFSDVQTARAALRGVRP
jgi:UDP-N-acetylmuramoyl-L-alanyl-D-glutamate--2,6-diaminopimelate ligase